MFDVISRKTKNKFVLIFISCDEIVTRIRIKKAMNNLNAAIGYYLPREYYKKLAQYFVLRYNTVNICLKCALTFNLWIFRIL